MARAVVLSVVLTFCVTFNYVFAGEDMKIVVLADGAVKGEKYWNGEFYEFYGIPYATVPTGRNRYQAPLPPKPWQGVFEASKKQLMCQQCYITDDDDADVLVDGVEECLVVNLMVPQLASETNLVPVVVYIHSGAFSGGSGTMANFHYVAKHDVVTISFNYRLGAIGFACLGNKEIPGNAGLKDQVAALRWIKKNVKKFGGDPDKITLAGYSVGATMAELLSLSKATTGLFKSIILDSGSALAPFAINRDPISTAKNIAISLGYNGTMSLEGLTEFYLNASIEGLAKKSINYYLRNSTFGFTPCIENVLDGIEPILTESPLDILKKGEHNDVAVLVGFSDMEGISRSIKFGTWREDMNEDFSDFIPADLLFDNDKSKDDFINEIKTFYFENRPVKADALQKYVDYFSACMFKYNILKSVKLRVALDKKPVYLYEFSYTGKLNIEHNYMDRIKGASHRDQTAYILDFFGYTNAYKDLDTRDRLTTMWTDFVKYELPTAFESALINVKWLPYTNKKRVYLEINKKLQLKQNVFEDEFNFWDKVYEKYYWTPTAPYYVETIDTAKENEKNVLKEKETPKVKDIPKAKETAKVKDVPEEKETPKVKEVAKEKETPKVKDVPKEKETPKVKDVPKDKEVPKVRDVPKEKETPQVKDVPKEKEIPKDKDVPKEKETPKVRDVPKEKETQKLKDVPKEKAVPKVKDVPKEKETPKIKDIPKAKETPKVKDVPKEKETPKEKDVPKEKEVPKVKDVPEENKTTKEKITPKEKENSKERNIPKETKKK